MELDINTDFGPKFSFYRWPSCCVALHAQLFDNWLMSNINNKLQLMQIISNVMLY